MMLNFDLLTIDEATTAQPHGRRFHIYELKWHTLSLHTYVKCQYLRFVWGVEGLKPRHKMKT